MLFFLLLQIKHSLLGFNFISQFSFGEQERVKMTFYIFLFKICL
jgi:hypothetical protein